MYLLKLLKKHNTINLRQLENILIESKGCKFISIEYVSDFWRYFYKTKNPMKNENLTLIKKAVFQIGYEYEKTVNNRAKKENKEQANIFITQSMNGYKWVVYNKIAINEKQQKAIRVYKLNTQNGLINPTILLNGKKISKKISKILSNYQKNNNPFESKKQYQAGLTINQVQPLQILFDNIITITIDKVTYKIKQ